MSKVLLIHDRLDIGPPYAKFLNKRGHSVILMKREDEVTLSLYRVLRIAEVVILHKDFGEVSGGELSSDQICEMIHDQAPHIRIGIVSGEYPHGKEHAFKCGADFYLNSTHLVNNWSLAQINKGYTTPEEQANRGRRVEMPTGISGKGERLF